MDYSFEDIERPFAEADERKKIELDNLLKTARLDETRKMLAWDVADLYYKIVNHDLFESYFVDMKEFAKYAGVNSATIFTDVRAVEFDLIHGFDREAFSLTKVYQLSRTSGDYDRFLDYVDSMELSIKNLSVKRISELIDLFYGRDNTSYVEFTLDGIRYKMPNSILKKYMVRSE